jgi:hypothetical protein
MTVVYCDFELGDDSEGDGSAEAPFKTIDVASDGLGGGDEVRCAKSADPEALSGTLTWTNGSTTVNTSADLTSELAAKDFIRKSSLNAADYDIWWEIASLTSSAITLVQTFRGHTETCASKKLGTTDTGTAGTDEDVQLVAGEGENRSSQLKISGGWDLSTEEQTGETWFRQTGTSRLGNGLGSGDFGYVELEKCHFLRYANCLYLNDGIGWLLDHVQLLGAGTKALQCNAAYDLVGSYLTSNGTVWLGFESLPMLEADNIVIVNGVLHSFGLLVDATIRNSSLYLYAGSISHGIAGYSITLQAYAPCKIYDSVAMTPSVQNCPPGRSVACKNIGGSSAEKAFQYYGYAQKDSANARSGSCICVTPEDAEIPFDLVLKLAAAASTQKMVSVYMKKSGLFNGTVKAALVFKGEFLADWATWTMTTSYQQFSLTAQAADIDESGVLELWIRVTGNAGSVYIDDLS